MGSIVSKIADEIKLHGSWDAYVQWRDQEEAFQKTGYICEDSTKLINDSTDDDCHSLGNA